MTHETEKHTPGRLTVSRFGDSTGLFGFTLTGNVHPIGGAVSTCETVADVRLYGKSTAADWGVAHANAERLALCWNQHDALVEAVGELSRWLNWAIERDIAIAGGGADVNAHDMIRNAQARAALDAE